MSRLLEIRAAGRQGMRVWGENMAAVSGGFRGSAMLPPLLPLLLIRTLWYHESRLVVPYQNCRSRP